MILQFDNYEIDFQDSGDFRYRREVKGLAEILDAILYSVTATQEDLESKGWDPLILTDLKQMLVNATLATLVGNFLILLNDEEYEQRWDKEYQFRVAVEAFENPEEADGPMVIIKGKEVKLAGTGGVIPPPQEPQFRMSEVDALTWLELEQCTYLGEKTKEQIRNLHPSNEDLTFFMEALHKIVTGILAADIKRRIV